MIDAEYVLPLRWDDIGDAAGADTALSELAAYLTVLSARIDVTVADGSVPAAFARHASAFPAEVRHLPVEPRAGRNGKVAGVMTGIRASRHERIVIADDDVRYDPAALATVVELLDVADVVTPQNFFDVSPGLATRCARCGRDTSNCAASRAFRDSSWHLAVSPVVVDAPVGPHRLELRSWPPSIPVSEGCSALPDSWSP